METTKDNWLLDKQWRDKEEERLKIEIRTLKEKIELLESKLKEL